MNLIGGPGRGWGPPHGYATDGENIVLWLRKTSGFWNCDIYGILSIVNKSAIFD